MSQEFYQIYDLENLELKLFLNKNSNLYFKSYHSDSILPIEQMPWKLQSPFYFTYLHDKKLGDMFRNHDIIGGIDLFVKWKHCLQEDLAISKGLVSA